MPAPESGRLLARLPPPYHVGGLAILWRCWRAGATVLHDGFNAAAVGRDLASRGVTHLSPRPAMLAAPCSTAASPPGFAARRCWWAAPPFSALCTTGRRPGWPSRRPTAPRRNGGPGRHRTPTPAPGAKATSATRCRATDWPSTPPGIASAVPRSCAATSLPTSPPGLGLDDGWLTSGDLGRIEPDGRPSSLGRADDMLVSGGRNVHPAEVEAGLAGCPGVDDVAVTGLPIRSGGDTVVALVVGPVSDATLRDWSHRTHLPGAARPRRIVRLPALPPSNAMAARTPGPARPGRGKSAMIDHLRRIVAAPRHRRPPCPAGGRRPGHDPLCLDFDLGPGDDDWLACLPAKGGILVLGAARKADRRLAMGTAQHFSTAGAARFATLANASRGLLADARGNGAAAFLRVRLRPRAVRRAAQHPASSCRRSCSSTGVAAPPRPDSAQAATAPAHWLDLLAPAAGPAAEPLQRPPEALGERALAARVQSAPSATSPLASSTGGSRPQRPSERGHRHRQAPFWRPCRYGNRAARSMPTAPLPRFSSAPRRSVWSRLVAGRADADALAGTAWPPCPICRRLALEPRQNRREQAFVENAVAAALAGLCLPRWTGRRGRKSCICARSAICAPASADRCGQGFPSSTWPPPCTDAGRGRQPPPPPLEWLQRHDEQRGAWYSGLGWVDGTGDGAKSSSPQRCAFDRRRPSHPLGRGRHRRPAPPEQAGQTEAKFQAIRSLPPSQQAACPAAGTDRDAMSLDPGALNLAWCQRLVAGFVAAGVGDAVISPGSDAAGPRPPAPRPAGSGGGR